MPGATDWQMQLWRNRALIELAEGRTDGPGLQSVRVWLAMVDAGRITDPSLPRQPEVKPLKPIQGQPLTNAELDGRVTTPYRGPTVGTREWFAARKKGKAA